MVDYDLGRVVGDKGETGNGIASITLHSTIGKVKTYRVTYTDGATFDFQVSDGSDASVTVDSSLSSTSTNPVQNKVINSALNGKANSSHNHNISDVTNLQTTLDSKASSSHTHTKSEVTDFPSIPSKTSDLTNDGDGSNVFVKDNDNRLNDNRNPLSNRLNPTSTNPVDLNNVRGTGFYYALGNVNIQYVSNLPSDWGNISFYLTVEETHDANYCKQTITSYNGGKMFVRGRVGGTWSVWKSCLSSDSVVDNLNSTSSTNVLSARQGKVLGDLIGTAIQYINQ